MYNVSIDTVGAVEKRIQENRAQKVANLIEQKIAFNPASLRDSISTGIPVGALLGAAAGGAYGLAQNPGYDEQTGERKSSIKNAIKKAIIGAGVGTLGGAALPGLASAALYGSGALQRGVVAPLYDLAGGKSSNGLFSSYMSKGDAARRKGSTAMLAALYGGNTNSIDISRYLSLLNPL